MGLKLLNDQSNDARILQLTDDSTWDDSDLPVYTDITDAKLYINYKTVERSQPLEYPIEIDVIQVFDDATNIHDLIFNIKSQDLGLGDNIPLEDGIYSIQYIVKNNTGGVWQFDSELELLLDMNIKNEIYKKVGKIPFLYFANNNYYTKDIDDALLSQSLYDGMNASAYVAQKENILTILETLQRQIK